MLDGLKPYPEYDAGDPDWMGPVPSHWRVLRARYLFREIDLRSVTGQETVLSMSQRLGLVPSAEMDERRLVPESHVGAKVCAPGDLVLNRLKAHLGVFAVANHAGLVSPDYTVFRALKDVLPRYFETVLKSPASRGELRMRSKGLVEGFWRLYTDDFYSIRLPVPPPDEQAAMVRFLGVVDRRVNRFIRAKRRLIEVLTEQKQAVITHAVTRGLNPAVRLKPSGIDWLIPEHWPMSRVKNEMACLNTRRIPLSGTERGKMTSRAYDYYGASGVIDKVEGFLFDDDLLLIAEDGANLVLRNLPLAIIARGKFWVNNHAHILKPRRGCLEYFAAVLESIEFAPWITGAAQPKLTQDRLMAVRIPVPPVVEQHQIIAGVAVQTRELTEVIDRTEREIDLIREYRTRLVADVVTGKVDVRAAAPLADADPAEEPPLDTDIAEPADEDVADALPALEAAGEEDA